MCSRTPRRSAQGWMTWHCTHEMSSSSRSSGRGQAWPPWLIPQSTVDHTDGCRLCWSSPLTQAPGASPAAVPEVCRFPLGPTPYLPPPAGVVKCSTASQTAFGACMGTNDIPLCHRREDNRSHQLLETGSLWWQESHHRHVCCCLLSMKRVWWAQIQILLQCTSSPDQMRNTSRNTVPHIAGVSWEILFLLYKTKNGYFCMAGSNFHILNHKKVVNTFQSAEYFLTSKNRAAHFRSEGLQFFQKIQHKNLLN